MLSLKPIRKYMPIYLMFLPVAALFALFSYYPLARGFVISLQNFRVIGDRPFVGFANYAAVLKDPVFYRAMENTLSIGSGILLFGFIAPLVVALSLNEVVLAWFKKTTQLILYVPHLFSWVVVGGIWIYVLSPDGGFVNEVMKALGGKPIHFLAEQDWSRPVMVATAVWKDMGYNCIIFLASIASISPSLYEAARMDGATKLQQIRYVTLPQLIPTMKVVIMLNALGVIRMFDQIFVFSKPAIARKVDVVMMYTYQKGILEFKMGVASAASFVVIALALVLIAVLRRVMRYDEE